MRKIYSMFYRQQQSKNKTNVSSQQPKRFSEAYFVFLRTKDHALFVYMEVA